jgi:hypothetical protein
MFVRQLPGWLRGHVLAALVVVMADEVSGYVMNVWLIAVRYQGF